MNILANALFSIEKSSSLLIQFIISSFMQIQFLVKLDCTQISEIMEVRNNWQHLKVQQTGAEE